MSKRYREVLQEVETIRTRDERDEDARADEAARADEVARATTAPPGTGADADHAGRVAVPEHRAGSGPDPAVRHPVGAGATTVPGGVAPGGVATLVRADPAGIPGATGGPDVATAHQAPPSPAGRPRRPDRPAPGHAPRRPDRPGNGPPDADQPLGFAWRGRHYDVTRILGHWREEEGWWRRPDGEPIRIEQSDLWRVEAVRNGGMARDQRGVYELSRRGAVWRLDRVWD